MIQVRTISQDGHIKRLTCSGHSESDDIGKDLICAGVSSILFGLCNALDEMCDEIGFIVEENIIDIYTDQPNETSDLILKTGIIQLKTIEESYKDFIRIKESEE